MSQNGAVYRAEPIEPMFEKALTPSDVGKLNRLVIPKQQAEKYFPLGGDVATGSLLGFEDEEGKEWRFRYSYWNSSQSYVLTKGWSRYVKDKRLDAGDVVFFERFRSHPHRMFIGSRRSRTAPPPTTANFSFMPPFRYNPNPTGADETGETSNGRRQVRLFGVNLDLQLHNSSPSSSSTQTTSSGNPFFSTQHQQHQHQHQHHSYHYYYYDQYNYLNSHHM